MISGNQMTLVGIITTLLPKNSSGFQVINSSFHDYNYMFIDLAHTALIVFFLFCIRFVYLEELVEFS